MRVLLAPMEGVLDSPARESLTEVNDYDLCITEFLRVVDQLLPVKVIPSGSARNLITIAARRPARAYASSCWGNIREWLAENAARAVELGSWGVDLNCGCPSKLVNGSGGGATLLKIPELIYRRRKSHARGGSGASAGDGESASWLGQRRHGSFEIADAVQQAGASESWRFSRPYQGTWL